MSVRQSSKFKLKFNFYLIKIIYINYRDTEKNLRENLQIWEYKKRQVMRN